MHEQGQIEFWGTSTMRTFRPLWIAEELGLENIPCTVLVPGPVKPRPLITPA